MARNAYAADTSVSVEKSRAEIESTLRRYGATSFMYGMDRNQAAIAFDASNRRVRFVLPLPDPHAREFTHTADRRLPRDAASQAKAWEQACRSRWRALCLCIKAKLEAVRVGITSFDEEFLAHIVLPSGPTVWQAAAPALERAYAGKPMGNLLGGPTS